METTKTTHQRAGHVDIHFSSLLTVMVASRQVTRFFMLAFQHFPGQQYLPGLHHFPGHWSATSLGRITSLVSDTSLGSSTSLCSFTPLDRTSLDSLVACQAAQWKPCLGVPVLVWVCAIWACALLPWRWIADEMKSIR